GSVITLAGTGFAANAADNQVSFALGSGLFIRVPANTATTTSLSVQVPDGVVSGVIQIIRLDLNVGSGEFPLPIAGSPISLALTSISPFYQVTPGTTVTLSGMGFA